MRIRRTINQTGLKELAGLLVFTAALGKLFLYFRDLNWFVFLVTVWGITAALTVLTRRQRVASRFVFLALVVWFLEIVLTLAADSVDPTLYDSAGFLREALYIEQSGGLMGLVVDLFFGDYPFFNRNPLVPYLCHLLRRPGLSWFVTGKTLAVASWGLAMLGLHYFTRRWFGRIEALVALGLCGFLFPVVQYQVRWIGSDLAVLGFVLFSLGAIRTLTTRTVLLSAALAGFGYWAKANAVFVLPVLLLAIVFESSDQSEVTSRTGLFFGTWGLITSPILTNNFLNHGNPLYNWNQRYLFVPRDYSGDVSDTLGSLPHVSDPTAMVNYVLEGFWGCLQGFWYFMDAPTGLAAGVIAAVVAGVFLKIRRELLGLLPLVFAGITFLAQGMNYYVTPRFMLFGWLILMGYGSFGIVELFRACAKKINLRWLPVTDVIPGRRTLRLAFLIPALFLLPGVFYYHPHSGKTKTLLNSVKSPNSVQPLLNTLRNKNVNPSTTIVDGPPSEYPLEYFGYRKTTDLPEAGTTEKLVEWLHEKDIQWMVVHRPLLERREFLQSEWLNLGNDFLVTQDPPANSPFCLEFASPQVLLISVSSPENSCPDYSTRVTSPGTTPGTPGPSGGS